MSAFVPPVAGATTHYVAESPPREGRYWVRNDDGDVVPIPEPSVLGSWKTETA